MTSKTKKLIIFGLEDFAQIAYEYFTFDSEYEVVAFCVNREYITNKTLYGLPVVSFEEVENDFSQNEYSFYVAITYGKLNSIRDDICQQVKKKGYKLASYVSSKAFVWKNVKLGEHVFIFENNTVQPFCNIGDNVILWSGNHIGHHSTINKNCFISSHVVVSGWCNIGDNCFVGVNSTIANSIKIGNECWLSHGCIINKNIPDQSLVKNNESLFSKLNKQSLFKILSKISNNRT